MVIVFYVASVLYYRDELLTPTTSDNSGHTATLRSAQMLGFASHFACPQTLSEIAKKKLKSSQIPQNQKYCSIKEV